MGFYIGNVYIKSNAILAPMAGFSDVGLRALSSSYGAGLTVTEMVSAKSLEYNNPKTKMLLALEPGMSPSAVQIFGSDPLCMAKACTNTALQKFDIIDINMGCPTPKIVKNGDGSALLSNMALAEEIIKECVKSTKKPITVKFRIGIDADNIIAVEFAKMCEKAGAKAITVHGRTVAQGYSGKSNLQVIKQVVQAVKIPVIASGDCIDFNSYKYILDYTGAAAVMIGRAAIGCPEIFAIVNQKQVKVDKLKQIKQHINYLKKVYPERAVVLNMRGIICHYLKNLSNTSDLKCKIVRSDSLLEIINLLNDFFNKK